MKRLTALAALLLFALPASAARLPIVASQDWWPVWSPDGKEIAFTRIEQRVMTLEVVELARHRGFRIAANQGQLGPSWSSDGRLAFSLGGRIYTSSSDGSGRVAVARGYAPAWRPGSSDVAYVNGGLWVSGARWAQDAIGRPAWSPDGSRLAFDRDDGVYVTTAPNAERRIAALVNPQAPVWSPDGRRIAFTASHRVWVTAADGSSAPRPVSSAFVILSDPSWSQEGDRLAYTGGGTLWLTSLDGGTRRLGASTDGGAAFSPVTGEIAFAGPHPGCPGHGSILLYRRATLTGTCTIRGTAGGDTIYGTGAGGDVILAGAGNDAVHARTGRHDTIECGPGRDTVWADRSDVVRGCEIVHRS